MLTYTLKVIAIKKETEDTLTLCFKQPTLRKVKYQAGQYLTLIFRINGRRYIRPYSFSSAPEVDSHLEVTVKRVTNGVVSNHINDKVQVGDIIEALPPMGDFIIPDKQYNSIFLWGAGSGITPLMSLLKSVLSTKPNVIVNLIYGNRNEESIIFNEQLNQLSREYKEHFKVWHFQTQLIVEKSLPDVIQGRINAKHILNLMPEEVINNSLHFICGPLGLKESVKESLAKFNVKDECIFSEDFELIKDPKDFKNIETRNIKLNFNGQEHTLEITKGKSILEVALDNNIELPYSCQTGNCSTCLAKLKTGKIKMIGIKKEREDLSEEEFLLCCSHPLTDNVYLEI